MEVHLPLDFERLPEFRRLVLALRNVETARGDARPTTEGAARGDARPTTEGAARGDARPTNAELAATFLWTRLFVELGLLAQSNAQAPGYFGAEDAALFEGTVAPLFGDDCPPLKLLEQAGVISPRDGQWYCDWFARLNEHLAGSYKSGAEKGNLRSAIVRQQKQIAVEALAQGSLLPEEIYRTRAGEPMPDAEKNRALVLIRNLDNCLGLPGRRKDSFSAGLLADAHAVITQHDGEALKQFYFWLSENRTKPVIPKTAEQILRAWDTVYAASK